METTIETTTAKAEALAKYLECETSEVEHDRGTMFLCDGAEYLVLSDDEADQYAADAIRESVWAFRASFILEECGLDLSGEKSLEEMQGKTCEGASDFITSLIERTCGMESFIDSAIAADGRGHFLSSYDSEEGEQNGFFIYRTN
jgi:hypothetical protein